MGGIDQLFSGTKVGRWVNHRNLYLLGLATILCGLAWSNALMSIGQFILVGNFLLEFKFKSKIKKLPKIAWLLVGLYLIHLLGLLWTTDFEYALKDLKIKLPLLVLPIIIGSSRNLNAKEWRVLIYIYLSTVFVLTLISLAKLIHYHNDYGFDKRLLSIYISHIRYGLNIAFAAILSFWLVYNDKKKYFLILGIWFVSTLFLFELYTGMICFFFAASISFLFVSKKLKVGWKIVFASIILFAILGGGYFVYESYSTYLKPEPISYDQNVAKKYTISGNNYHHNFGDVRTTNGIYIERYISYFELRQEWKRRSNLDPEKKDKKGQHLESTLIRYLTSRGLTKDSVGLSKLSDREIKAIENGVANYRYLELNPIELRLHKTFYEIEVYSETGFADGASIALRLEYWKTACKIFKTNEWVGVGTGDIKDAFKTQYDADDTWLSEQYRRRTHNQYLTFAVTFGMMGILYFLIYLIYPLLTYRGHFNIPFIAFWIIATLSFLTEDTLETQAGVTFFALFFCLFVLNQSKSQDQISR